MRRLTTPLTTDCPLLDLTPPPSLSLVRAQARLSVHCQRRRAARQRAVPAAHATRSDPLRRRRGRCGARARRGAGGARGQGTHAESRTPSHLTDGRLVRRWLVGTPQGQHAAARPHVWLRVRSLRQRARVGGARLRARPRAADEPRPRDADVRATRQPRLGATRRHESRAQPGLVARSEAEALGLTTRQGRRPTQPRRQAGQVSVGERARRVASARRASGIYIRLVCGGDG